MVGIALKGQCDFVYIMVPPEVSLKEKCSSEKNRVNSIEHCKFSLNPIIVFKLVRQIVV